MHLLCCTYSANTLFSFRFFFFTLISCKLIKKTHGLFWKYHQNTATTDLIDFKMLSNIDTLIITMCYTSLYSVMHIILSHHIFRFCQECNLKSTYQVLSSNYINDNMPRTTVYIISDSIRKNFQLFQTVFLFWDTIISEHLIYYKHDIWICYWISKHLICMVNCKAINIFFI